MGTRATMSLAVGFLAAVAVLTGCSSSDNEPVASSDAVVTTEAEGDDGGSAEDGDDEDAVELFPDVVAVTAEMADDGTWNFAVTLSSPYDTAARYADAWRVLGPDGAVYGVRELAHDHQNEQPFTRSLSGVEIPDGVSVVTVEGRDQVSGWGGETVEHALER